jgi:surface antigen
MFHGVSDLAVRRAREDATGALPKSSLAGILDAEDWRRAKAALSTALDPQGNGSLVGWDNPDSGNKGSFTPHNLGL